MLFDDNEVKIEARPVKKIPQTAQLLLHYAQ